LKQLQPAAPRQAAHADPARPANPSAYPVLLVRAEPGRADGPDGSLGRPRRDVRRRRNLRIRRQAEGNHLVRFSLAFDLPNQSDQMYE